MRVEVYSRVLFSNGPLMCGGQVNQGSVIRTFCLLSKAASGALCCVVEDVVNLPIWRNVGNLRTQD